MCAIEHRCDVLSHLRAGDRIDTQSWVVMEPSLATTMRRRLIREHRDRTIVALQALLDDIRDSTHTLAQKNGFWATLLSACHALRVTYTDDPQIQSKLHDLRAQLIQQVQQQNMQGLSQIQSIFAYPGVFATIHGSDL